MPPRRKRVDTSGCAPAIFVDADSPIGRQVEGAIEAMAQRAADRFPHDDVFERCEPTGTHCSDCGSPQVNTPSGVSCKFGHGGAPSLEETRGAGPVSPPETDAPEKGRERVPPGVPRIKRASALSSFLDADDDFPDKGFAYAQRKPAATFRIPPKKTAEPISVSLVGIPTTRLIELTEWPSDVDVRGALVKFAPVIQSSKRGEFDGDRIKREILAAGAYAVMNAPRIVPDGVVTSKRDAAVRRAIDPSAAIEVWFSTIAGVTDAVREVARDTALTVYNTAQAVGKK